MLILTRRPGETIIIGDDITITVLGVKGCNVRCGISAPKDLSVHREEIYRRVLREKFVKQKDEANETSDKPEVNAERDFWKSQKKAPKKWKAAPSS